MKERTLIIGNGPMASGIARALLSAEKPILVATPDTAAFPDLADPSPLFEVRTQTRICRCTGTAGDFQVVLGHPDGSSSPQDFAHIVIAEEGVKSPLFSLYGLSACQAVMSLSQADGRLFSPPSSDVPASDVPAPDLPEPGQTAAFIVGLAAESHPHVLETAMETCLKLQRESGLKTVILTRNLKVGAPGMEALYHKTRDAGVVYVKFSDALPTFHQDPGGKVRIAFVDDVTRLPFTLDADVTVVDEASAPSPRLKDLSRILCLDADSAGYIQSDNVHRLSVLTNRKGILAAGASRGALPPSDWKAEIAETALAVLSLIKGAPAAPENKARIDAGACVRCLTCFRLCPYHAITLNTRPVVAADACERCGICAAECPAEAITIDDLNVRAFSERLLPIPRGGNGAAFTPFLVAFCCSRSAGRAKAQAALSGLRLPERLSVIEVPCSGAVALEHLMAAFQNRADGVLVFTCHEGNCHSERGNILAARRAVHLKQVLKEIGIDPNRLLLKTLASNMAAEFAEAAGQFEKQIAEAGPLAR